MNKPKKADKLLAPRVTVLMSVYNSEEYLREAIESILNQSYEDFEFLIINDGSKDKSLQIIKSYEDPRIKIISRENRGLVYSLNEGLENALGEYIARQDSDDISLPDRLEKEVEFLDANKKCSLVGSNYIVIDESGKELTRTNIFTTPRDLKLALISCNQYGHGSVMIRKDVLKKVGNYDATVGRVEDYHLWQRISRVADVANIEKPLYKYRKNDNGISYSNLDKQIEETLALRDLAFKHYLKNKSTYRLFNYSPSGTNYKARKAILFRDLAYLYNANNEKLWALFMLTIAMIYRPMEKRSLKYFIITLFSNKKAAWEYEFL